MRGWRPRFLYRTAGLTTANCQHRVLGQTFSLLREKSSVALESAKHSSAGTALADGLQRAANASSEQIGKLKESEAYKKSASMASSGYERTSIVASEALEKVSTWAARCGSTRRDCLTETIVAIVAGACGRERRVREGQARRQRGHRDDQG